MEEPQQMPVTKEPRQRPRAAGKIIAAVIIVLLLAVIGWLAWQWKLCLDKDSQTDAANKQLQNKVDDLTKQLSDAKKSSTTPSTSTSSATPCGSQVAISQSLRDNIAAAVSSQNLAALAGYMATSVNMVVAGSEKNDTEAPDQAVTTMQYLNSGTSPWNFALPAATLNGFKAGFYKQYFTSIDSVGESANKYVVSVGFDTCGKINRVFMAASADLLTE